VRFLSDPDESIAALTAKDVVILPAFGVTIEMLETLQGHGCTLVDTTCGSVLNVWKNVRRYAEEGLTTHLSGRSDVLTRLARRRRAVQGPTARPKVPLVPRLGA
jgi:4-hydroxy-3-methylbut-2-enyl diphosphate reductase